MKLMSSASLLSRYQHNISQNISGYHRAGIQCWGRCLSIYLKLFSICHFVSITKDASPLSNLFSIQSYVKLSSVYKRLQFTHGLMVMKIMKLLEICLGGFLITLLNTGKPQVLLGLRGMYEVASRVNITYLLRTRASLRLPSDQAAFTLTPMFFSCRAVMMALATSATKDTSSRRHGYWT